jgi:hypothetical protein
MNTLELVGNEKNAHLLCPVHGESKEGNNQRRICPSVQGAFERYYISTVIAICMLNEGRKLRKQEPTTLQNPPLHTFFVITTP